MKREPKYTVLTLSPQKLTEACTRLEAVISADGVVPDAILTIASGGDFVGGMMFNNIPHFSTKAQRPSTKYKGSLVKAILKIIPYSIKNRLRIIEAKKLKGARKTISKVNLPPLPYEGTLLIIDDAVDSGITLKAVSDTVAEYYPDLSIKTAVITVTTQKPVIHPDYSLFRNSTLIRFPWSADY